MIVAVDTSALAKILVQEEESAALRQWLAEGSTRNDEYVLSTIALTELRRLAIRLDIDADRVEPVLRPFRIVRLSESILQLSGRLPDRHLGTLDAIHIATALSIEATTLVSYDDRQTDAAAREGLHVVAPT